MIKKRLRLLCLAVLFALFVYDWTYAFDFLATQCHFFFSFTFLFAPSRIDPFFWRVAIFTAATCVYDVVFVHFALANNMFAASVTDKMRVQVWIGSVYIEYY